MAYVDSIRADDSELNRPITPSSVSPGPTAQTMDPPNNYFWITFSPPGYFMMVYLFCSCLVEGSLFGS